MTVRTLELRLSGVGGQGLILAGEILAGALARDGMKVALSRSYEPTSRGGLSRTDLVASEDAVEYPLATALDQLVILDQFAADASTGLLRADALVVVDEDRVSTPPRGSFRVQALPLFTTARSVGNPRAANIVALGALSTLAGTAGAASLEAAIRDRTPARFLERNVEALNAGIALAGQESPGPRVATAAT